MQTRGRVAAAVVALLLAGAAPAWADEPNGSGIPAPPAAAAAGAPGSLARAEFEVNSGDFGTAIPLLTAIIRRQPRNADALNLMGYSLRKTGQFNLSLQYYQAALAIAPQNLGANEYLGELYVLMGETAKARHQLAILKATCGADCVQTRDLTAAIATGTVR
ncbi:MAG TPA: tetratricopeptide repeat protein [Stellaceae bacterium]|nr:tetratricopeptide repeat protein [Stellaceae bacterium]